ncbi:MAG: DCC1-like thiol-disulfide oxidoreductase family protein [Sandaracinaceae bacterium]|nr:DCC1-like thiol-disulfide oxidoreductase family protein [Sandaracinaceae bacterium]
MRTPIVLALLHLAIVLAHGAAHVALGIFDPPLQTAYVVLVIHVLPVVAILLLVRRQVRAGLATLELALLGSLVYATYRHFVLVSHDHVLHLPSSPWAPVFQVTAVLLGVVDLIGVVAVLAAARRALLSSERHVLLIDGTCIFCSRLVQHVLDHDRSGRFHFAHLQSEYGKAARVRHGADPNDVDGVYVLVAEGTERERLLIDGAAGRAIWPSIHLAATPLLLLPTFVLDPFYRLFARVRYRLFGQYESCRVPTEAERARFVGDAA